jgi:hypothetical protein
MNGVRSSKQTMLDIFAVTALRPKAARHARSKSGHLRYTTMLHKQHSKATAYSDECRNRFFIRERSRLMLDPHVTATQLPVVELIQHKKESLNLSLDEKAQNVAIGLGLFDELRTQMVSARPFAEISNVLTVQGNGLAANFI